MGAGHGDKSQQKHTYGTFVLLRMPVLDLGLDLWCGGEVRVES